MPSNNPTFKPLSPEAFAEMARLRAAINVDEPKAVQYIRQYNELLREATRSISRDTPISSIEQLLPDWLRSLDKRIKNTQILATTIDGIDLFLDVAVMHNLGPRLLTEQAHRDILVWCSLSSIIQHEGDLSCPGVVNAEKLLAPWLNDLGANDKPVPFATLIQCLYGPGVWELYGTDVSQRKLPSYLYKQGIQTVCPEKTVVGVKSNHAIDLPSNRYDA